MKPEIFNEISPFVRMVKIQKTLHLSGEWVDYDNVFTFIADGQADFVIDGIKYHIGEGDAILMHPFQTHLIYAKSSLPLVQYTYHFDFFFNKGRSSLNQIGSKYCANKADTPKEEMIFSEISPVVHISHLEQLYVKNRFLIMRKEFIEKKEGYEAILKSIAIELVRIFLRNLSNQTLVKSKMTRCWATVEKAITHINEYYYDEELDNHKISKASEVTPNYLSQVFKKQLGISMHSYINHIRIEKSKVLLLQTNKKLTEIASVVGFSSIYVFSKVFKKTVGITPSEFVVSNNKYIDN